MIDWRSLDTFRLCAAAGCAWRVQSPWPESKCWMHGGLARPQYRLGEDGEIVESRFLPPEADEPWEV